MKKITMVVLLMTSLEAFSCKIERARSETHLALDPISSQAQLMTKTNLTSFVVTGCDGSIPFLMIGSSVAYHQNDTSKRETLLADVDPSKNNCSIELPNELKAKKTDALAIRSETVLETVKNRKYFIDTCLSYEVSEFSGRKLEFEMNEGCQVTETQTNAELGSVQYLLKGQTCLVKTPRNTNLQIKSRINPACLGAELLNDPKLIAQDIETQFTVWPAQVTIDSGKKKTHFDQALSSRPVRYTIVPSRANVLQPKALQRIDGQPSFVQVVATNIDFAKLEISMIGAEKYAVQPTFFVQNNSNSYCDKGGTNCISPSEYAAPIAAGMELFEIDPIRKSKTPKGRWLHAVKVPARFVGMVEVRPENNLSGTQAGALVLDKTLEKGKTYLLTADFFEPRSFMDNDARLKKLFSGDVAMPKLDRKLEDGALPALPSLGINTDLQPLAPIQSNKLNEAGFEFFTTRINMKNNWTNHFELACNSSTHTCANIAVNRPFIRMKIQIEITESGAIKVLRSEKVSTLFDSYDVDLSQADNNGMLKKVCK